MPSEPEDGRLALRWSAIEETAEDALFVEHGPLCLALEKQEG